MRGSRFDPKRYVSNVPAVKAAYVQAMAERMGRRMPGGKAQTAPAAVAAPTAEVAAPDPRLQSAELRAELEAVERDPHVGAVDPELIREAIAEIRRLRAQVDDFDDEMRVAMERAED